MTGFALKLVLFELELRKKGKAQANNNEKCNSTNESGLFTSITVVPLSQNEMEQIKDDGKKLNCFICGFIGGFGTVAICMGIILSFM